MCGCLWQGSATLVLESHSPAYCPTIPELTVYVWLNIPDPGNQQEEWPGTRVADTWSLVNAESKPGHGEYCHID